MAVRDEDDAYDGLREACDRGEGCPRCLTTIPWLIRKVPDMKRPPFECSACGFTFRGWDDAFCPGSAMTSAEASNETR